MEYFQLKKLSLISLCLFLAISCASNDTADRTPEQKKAEIYYAQGTSELISKNYSQALINLTKARDLDPNDSQIRNNLGMAYFFKEQTALAEKELEKSIALDSKNTDAKMNLGAVYLEKNKLQQARKVFEEVATDLTFPNQFRNFYNLAILNLKEGDRKEAFEFLNKSIKEKEEYCQAHFKLGELYTEEYRFKEALASFKEAGKGTCVKEPAPHYQQALALINLSRNGEAAMKLKEIVEKFPTTRFKTLAQIQLKKMKSESTSNQDESLTRATQTEVIKQSQSIDSPNF